MSFGRVGYAGNFDSALTSVPGPMCRSVRDAARYIDAIAGPTNSDPTSLPRPRVPTRTRSSRATRPRSSAASARRGRRRSASRCVIPRSRSSSYEAALALCADAGIELVDIDVQLAAARRRVGPDLLARHRGQSSRRGTRSLGRRHAGLARGLQAVDRINSEQLMRSLRRRFELLAAIGVVFDEVDLLLTPTTATTAFVAEGPPPFEIGGQKVGGMGSVPYTAPFNISGMPGVSIPVGLRVRRAARRPAGRRSARRRGSRAGVRRGRRSQPALGEVRAARVRLNDACASPTGIRAARARDTLPAMTDTQPRAASSEAGAGARVGRGHRGRAGRAAHAAADLDAGSRSREHVRPRRRPRASRSSIPGLPGPQSWKALKQRLKTAGYRVKDVHTVVVTHSHPDHFGGAGRIAREAGAQAGHAPRVLDVDGEGTEPAARALAKARRAGSRWKRPRTRRVVDVPPDELPTINDPDVVRDDTEETEATSSPWGAITPWGTTNQGPPLKRRMMIKALRMLFTPPEPTDRVHHGERIRLGEPRVVRRAHARPHRRPSVPLGPGVGHAAHRRPRAPVDHAARVGRAPGRLAASRTSRRSISSASCTACTIGLPAHGHPVRRRPGPGRGDQGTSRGAHGAAARRRARARPGDGRRAVARGVPEAALGHDGRERDVRAPRAPRARGRRRTVGGERHARLPHGTRGRSRGDDRDRHRDRERVGRSPLAADPQRVRQRRHARVGARVAQRRPARAVSRRHRSRPRALRRAAGPREPRRAHRGQRSDRADAVADGSHRRRAREPRRLAARSVRRRARRRRGVGPRRGRHAEPHRDDGGRVPRARAFGLHGRGARSCTSRSPTRRTSARGAPSTCSTTSATR